MQKVGEHKGRQIYGNQCSAYTHSECKGKQTGRTKGTERGKICVQQVHFTCNCKAMQTEAKREVDRYEQGGVHVANDKAFKLREE